MTIQPFLAALALLIAPQDQELPSLISDLNQPDRRTQAEERLRAIVLEKDIRRDLETALNTVDAGRAAILRSILRLGHWRWLLSEELYRVLDDGLGFQNLVSSIESGSLEKRRESVEALAYLGDPGLIPFLKEWQSSSDEAFRPWPTLVRAVCLDREALPELIPLLGHPDRHVMGNAYALLYMLADDSIVPKIKPLLAEKGDARMRAYYLLDKLAPKEVESIAREFLKEKSVDLRFSGARTLSKLHDPAAVEPIVEFIQREQKPETIALLIQWLKPFQTQEVLGLYAGMLEHREAVIAKLAVDAVRGLDAEKSRPLLLKALTHWSEELVVIPAIDALLKMEPSTWKHELNQLLRSPIDIHRANAALMAGRAHLTDEKEQLERLTSDRAPRVQMRALEALARIDMAKAAPLAEKLSTSADLHVRLAAASVLSQGDVDRAFPVLKRMAETGVDFEKGFAVRTLHALKHPEAQALARKMFKGENESVRLVALSALVEMGVEDALERILEFVPQSQQLTAYAVWLVEQHYTHEKYIPRFAQELKNKQGDIKNRMLAAVWLGYFGGPESRAALLPGLDDSDFRVQVTVGLALARGGEREKTVPALIEMTKHPEAREAAEVWIALGWTKDERARDLLLKSMDVAKAIEALGVLGDASVLPAIRKHMVSRSDLHRDSALFAAAKLGDAVARRRFFRRVDDLLKGPDNTRPGWFGDMVFQLGFFKSGDSIRLLKSVIQSPDQTLKVRAISALQEIGSLPAAEILIVALDDAGSVGGQYTPVRYIREMSLKALGKLTGKRFTGTMDEQVGAMKKWWESEGKATWKADR